MPAEDITEIATLRAALVAEMADQKAYAARLETLLREMRRARRSSTPINSRWRSR